MHAEVRELAREVVEPGYESFRKGEREIKGLLMATCGVSSLSRVTAVRRSTHAREGWSEKDGPVTRDRELAPQLAINSLVNLPFPLSN